METLISKKFLRPSTLLLSQSLSPLYFRLFPNKIHNFGCSNLRKCSRKRDQIAVSCSMSASTDPIASNYGGWEDLVLLDELGRSGKLDPFWNFLISVGIDDGKHAVLFFLGFVSALVVSRVRFSSMAFFPISVLVFIIGFSAGVAQTTILGDSLRSFGRNGGNFRVLDEKFRDLGVFLSDLDGKMSDLKNGLEGGVDLNHLDMNKISYYLNSIEYVRTTISQARKTLDDSVAGDLLKGCMSFDWDGGKKPNLKSSRKKKELGVSGFDFVQILGGLFQENLIGLRTSKAKDTPKEELTEQFNSMVTENPTFVSPGEIKERGSNPLLNSDQENTKIKESKILNNQNLGTLKGNAAGKERTVKTVPGSANSVRNNAAVINGKKSYCFKDDWCDDNMLAYDGELSNVNRSSRFTTRQENLQTMVFKHNYERKLMQNYVQDSVDCDTDQTKHMVNTDSEASSLLEQTLEISNKHYSSSNRSKRSKLKVETAHGVGIKKAIVTSEAQAFEENQQPIHGVEDGSAPSSSTTSVDEEFNQNMKEATDLLKLARKCMMSQTDEETADTVLYKSARLLSAAVATRPMSLLAVGQLGNTYLLHGELKLKISRELRTLILKSDDLFSGKGAGVQFKKLNTHVMSRDDVASVLVEVCEECENLLVKAGRKYRMALSIDGNDVRALYNWGLALSFRAQLIADIGPEAAFDADKVYLAAIDKFDALMSRSKAYTPDALYRWGIALQQRSHLRPPSSREKTKLLQQAKSLFEDALSMESDNKQAKEALLSCLSELNYNGQW